MASTSKEETFRPHPNGGISRKMPATKRANWTAQARQERPFPHILFTAPVIANESAAIKPCPFER